MTDWTPDDDAKANALVARILRAEEALRGDLDDHAREHEQEHRDLALDDLLVLCAPTNLLVFYQGRRFRGAERTDVTDQIASLLARAAPLEATSAQLFERGVAVRRWDRSDGDWTEQTEA